MSGDSARTVLTTGASKGIGEAAALRLHARGFTVLAGVRKTEDGEALRERAGTDRLVPVLLDVTDPEAVARAARIVEERTGARGLDGLVNNAGIAVAAPLEFLPLEGLRRQLEVNVIGQVAVTQALLPALRRARGRIVFVGSIAGRSALPLVGAYGASKFALEAIADALRVELMDSGIAVSVIEPGAVATPIWQTGIDYADRLLESAPPELEQRYGPQLAGLRRFAERGGGRGTPPERVAEAIENALTTAHPRARYLIGRDAKIRLAIERLAPTRLRDRLIAKRIRKMAESALRARDESRSRA